MSPMKKTGKVAGLLYLALIGCGFFYLKYVPSTLSAHGDSAVLVGNINIHGTLFRMGILVEVLSNLIFLSLSLAFYKLLSTVNKSHAVAMVILVAIGVVISFIWLQNKFAMLTLLNEGGIKQAFTPGQLKAQVLLDLDFYKNGIVLAEIFWGLWLFPLGYLVYKSGFLPKIIGIILMIGCFGYLANFAGVFFFPGYNDMAISNYVTLPASLGELCICMWLLIIGVRDKKGQDAVLI